MKVDIEKLVLRKVIEWSITGGYLDIEFENLVKLHDTVAGYLGYELIDAKGRSGSTSTSTSVGSQFSQSELVRVHVMLCRIEIVLGERELARGTVARLKDWLTLHGLAEDTGALCTVVALRAEVLRADGGGGAGGSGEETYMEGALDAVAASANRAALVSSGGSVSAGALFDRDDLQWAVGSGERVLDTVSAAQLAVDYALRGQLREAVWVAGRALQTAGGVVPSLWALRAQLCVLVARGERERGEASRAWALAGAANAGRALELAADGRVAERARQSRARAQSLLAEE